MSAPSDRPVLDDDTLDAALLPWLGDIPATDRIAVGVSGGADSMLLLHALARRLDRSRLLALTVDHGLRPEAGDEAAMVSTWCAGEGIAHQTLRWTDRKPASGLQAAARTARYRLLAIACNAAGIRHLFVAHHGDDQAETLFARLARGAGLDGLSGMPPVRQIAAGPGDAVRLVRPLLSLRRADLRATSVARKIPLADDPSNDDDTYERVRRRAFLAAAGVQDFLSVPALMRSATALQAELDRREQGLAEDFAAAGGWFRRDGSIRFDATLYARLPEARRRSLIARAMEAAGAGHAIAQPGPDLAVEEAVTMGGALARSQRHIVSITREPAALLGRADGTKSNPPSAVTPGKTLWDGRFIVDIPDRAGALSLSPLALPRGDCAQAHVIARAVTRDPGLSTMPGLWCDGTLIAVPDCLKTMLPGPAIPWNTGLMPLNVTKLIEERFYRRMIRY